MGGEIVEQIEDDFDLMIFVVIYNEMCSEIYIVWVGSKGICVDCSCCFDTAGRGWWNHQNFLGKIRSFRILIFRPTRVALCDCDYHSMLTNSMWLSFKNKHYLNINFMNM